MVQWNELSRKLLTGLKRYKYAVLVLLLGVALLLLPVGQASEPEQVEKTYEITDEDYTAQMERRLSEMLMRINGAGRVEVMLTLKRSSRTDYQTDTQSSVGDTQQSEEQKTVILSEGSAYDKAAVSSVEYPQFQGALIISEGADAAAVKLDLIQAVASITGLSSDCITVVKMK